MSLPTTMTPTPYATITVADGVATDSSGEFWQRVAGNKFLVYENVPNDLAQNILQNNIPDTAIALMLAAYPKRVSS